MLVGMEGGSGLFDGFTVHLSNSIPIQDISVEIFMRIDLAAVYRTPNLLSMRNLVQKSQFPERFTLLQK